MNTAESRIMLSVAKKFNSSETVQRFGLGNPHNLSVVKEK